MGYLGGIIFLFASLVPNRSGAAALWSSKDVNLYRERRFIELRQATVSRGEPGSSNLIALQSDDLAGCRALHRGNGGIPDLLSCMSFLGRESQIGLYSSGRKRLVRDINFLCPKLFSSKAAVAALLKTNRGRSLGGRDWRPCLESVWRQVYLTSYANFDADPVGTVSFFHRVQDAIPADSLWTARSLEFFQRK